jgi:hypothetical protein
MYLGNYQWPLRLEKMGPSLKYFALTSFHVNLGEVWNRCPFRNESVQRNGWHVY